MPDKKWGNYSSEDVEPVFRQYEQSIDSFSEDFDQIIEADPILMLPPPSSGWVVKKVAEVKRRMGFSFKEIENKVEEFFLGNRKA